jgi:hypothetical protein
MQSFGPEHLNPTFYIDSDNAGIVAFANKHIGNAKTDKEKAVNLYYAV